MRVRCTAMNKNVPLRLSRSRLTGRYGFTKLARVAERFVVTGGSRLSGEVAVGGAKNSVLKLMAATLLAEGTSTITNCPDILDVPLMAEVLRGLGATVELAGATVRITSPDEPKYDADFAAVRQFRASVCVLGPLVGRCKRAKVALPGGDAIGSRPLDMHQAGLRQLGAVCNIEHGCVVAQADSLARRGNSAGVPLGRGDREHLDGCGAGRGCHDDSQRGARARRGRPVHDVEPDGRAGRRCGLADDDDHRRTAALPDGASRDRRPNRGRHVGHRRGDDPRRRHSDRRRPGASSGRAAQAARRRRHGHPDGRQLPDHPVRAAEGRQRRDAAVSGFPDGPAADGDCAWRRSPTARR